jgi:hypothetical protein
MRLRDTIIWFVSIFLAVALLITSGSQLDYINSQRQEMKLISNKPLENAPPSLAFATVAMGAFRGLVVDILWMRADRLKDQGQFFDAKQLAEWITTLQPRFAAVWDFHSWNMAYNISVAIPATQPEERWRWVKNGYELLRDRGIPLNPRSIVLYRQLALTFQHKIGGVTDDAHKYYKLQLAAAMEPLLGPSDNQTFCALAEAPTEWRQIENDPNIRSLITALKSADPSAFSQGKRGGDGDKFVSNYLSLRQNPGRFKTAAFKIIDNFRGTEDLKKFDIFAKAYQLRKVWKLDPVLMQKLNKLYGPIDWNDPNTHLPLDWRHPDSHAIYWAVKGLQEAGKEGFSIDEANTDRIVVHSLQDLFRRGKIFIYRPPAPAQKPSDSSSQPPQRQMPEVFLRPDLRMFEPYNQAILKVIEKYEDPNKGGDPKRHKERLGTNEYSSHQIGHRNMLENAVLSFYQAGHRHQAQKIYNQLRQLYPQDEFKVPIAIFARNLLLDELRTLHIINAKEIVQLLLRQSYFFYAICDDSAAAGTENLAKEVYNHYRSMDKKGIQWDLPEFPLLRYFAIIDLLNDRQYSFDLRRTLYNRIKIEKPELARELEQQQEEILKGSQTR